MRPALREGRTRAAPLTTLVLAACAASPTARGSDPPGQPAANGALDGTSLEVALDTRPRPPVALRMEVADANDAARGAHLASQLERFRPCVDRHRAPRGHAGGRFGISGVLRADGTLERSSVISLDLGAGFERCLAAEVAASRWPPSDVDRVGFTASVIVHDSSRRAPGEVRPLAPEGGAASATSPTPRAPAIVWSELRATSPAAEEVRRELLGRSEPLSDCLWHAWPSATPSADVEVTVRVASSGALTGTVRGEGEPPTPELVECLGRMISVIPAPKAAGGGGAVHGRLSVGAGGGRLGR